MSRWSFYSFFFLAFSLFLFESSFAKNPDIRGFCKIMMPGKPYLSGRCSDGYAIVYKFNKGLSLSSIPFAQIKFEYAPVTFAEDFSFETAITRIANFPFYKWDGVEEKPCYQTLEVARKKLASDDMFFCDYPLRYKHCFIMNTEKKTTFGNGYSCPTKGGRFAIIHGVDNIDNTCYENLSEAVSDMMDPHETTCHLSSHRGQCNILYAGEYDKQKKGWPKRYAILYKGFILNDTSYKTMNAAIRKMHRTPVCGVTKAKPAPVAPKKPLTSRPEDSATIPLVF